MTSKERMICALRGGIPDRVPTFELEFQLSEELLGKRMLSYGDMDKASPRERERMLAENAQFLIQVYDTLEHDAICIHLEEPYIAETVRRIREYSGDRFMLLAHGDGTFAIPDGDGMLEFSYRIADDPASVHAEAEPCVGRPSPGISGCWTQGWMGLFFAATIASTRGRSSRRGCLGSL